MVRGVKTTDYTGKHGVRWGRACKCDDRYESKRLG